MPTPIDVVNEFCTLFLGELSAVGTEDGGCQRLNPDNDDYSWFEAIEEHLTGESSPVGVYPMVHTEDDQWVVKWGCIDFDEGDEESWLYARDVYQVLAQFGITSWIERSRSKGYHVWVFLEDWCEADIVRRSLLAACQIVSAPTKEINPKQSELAPGQLGNYVRLPYPNAFNDPPEIAWNGADHRRVMVNTHGQVTSLVTFLGVAADHLVTQKQLEELAWYYIAPSRGSVSQRDWSRLEGDAVERLRGKARIIFEQGPLESPDSKTNFRGQTLFKLARYLSEDGKHTPEEALELLRDADARWGKFHERPDGEQRLQEMVNKAFL